MIAYIVRRILLAIPTLFGISVLSFVIMHLPPGDFLSSYASILSQQGEGIATEQLEQLRISYGLGEPMQSARAGGLSEGRLVWEYPVRVALNPFVSAVGFALPELISSATIVSIVLSLPMTGPLFLSALQSQDMYLAGAFVLLISALTIVGMLISDVLLAWLDPRIRYSR